MRASMHDVCFLSLGIASALATAVPLSAGPPIEATWTGNGENNNWDNPENWDILDVPCNSSDRYDAVINNYEDVFYATLNVDCAVNSLKVTGLDTLAMDSGRTLTIGDGGFLLDGKFGMNAGGAFTDLIFTDGSVWSGEGIIRLTDDPGNRIDGDSAASTLNIDEDAELTFWLGRLDMGGESSLTLMNDGLIEFDEMQNANLCLADGSSNSGKIDLFNGAEVTLACGMIQNTGGEINLDDSTLRLESGGVIGGELDRSGQQALLVLPNGSSFTFGGDMKLVGDLVMESTGDPTELIFQEGTSFIGGLSIMPTSDLNNHIRSEHASGALIVEKDSLLAIELGTARLGTEEFPLALQNYGIVHPSSAEDVRFCVAEPGTLNAGFYWVVFSTLTLNCGIIDNTGGLIIADHATRIRLDGGGIRNGTLEGGEGGPYEGRYVVPDGSVGTLGGELDLIEAVIALDSAGNQTDLIIEDATVFQGTGIIKATNRAQNRITGVAIDDRWTIDSDALITFKPSGAAEDGNSGLIDLGAESLALTIDGNLTVEESATVDLRTTDTQHNGLIRVVGGGLLNVLAGNVTGAGSFELDGGRLSIQTEGSVDVSGSVTLANGGELELTSDNRFAAGELTMDAASTLDAQSNARLTVNGSFSYATVDGSGWQWASNATLELAGAATDACDPATYSTIEAGGAAHKIPNLVLQPGARVRIVDQFDNDSGEGGSPEALHVGTLTVAIGDGVFYLDGFEIVADNITGDIDCQVIDGNFFVHQSTPPQGAIDARQPFNLDGSNPAGWDSIEITYCGDVSDATAGDFEAAQVGGDGIAPGIASIEVLSSDTVRVNFDQMIEPKAWTAVTHLPSGACTRFGYLPADASGDGVSGAADVLHLIDCLSGSESCPLYSSDIDRSGAAGPPDVLRLIDLLNGAGEFDAFNGVTLPSLP